MRTLPSAPFLMALVLLGDGLLARASDDSRPSITPTPAAVEGHKDRALTEISRPPISLSEVSAGCSTYGPPIIDVVVGKDGVVQRVGFLRRSGCKEADARIASWVKKWVFAPAVKDDRATSSKIKVSVNIDQ
jgi:hypothetical protein